MHKNWVKKAREFLHSPGILKRMVIPSLCVIVVSVFAPISLWTQNRVAVASLQDALVPVLLYAAYGLAAFFIATLITQKTNKSALAVSLLMLLFSFYLPVENTIREIGWRLHLALYYWHALAIVLFVAFLAILALVLFLPSKAASLAVRFLAFVFAVLFAFNLTSIVPAVVSRPKEVAEVTSAEGGKRNIYFILFDEYSSNRYMEKGFGYDNSATTDALEAMGFSVSYSSKNEYNSTSTVMTNFFNLDYIVTPEDVTADPVKVKELRQNNPTFSLLRENGYNLVFVGGGYFYGYQPVEGTGSTQSSTMMGETFQDILYARTPLYPFTIRNFSSEAQSHLVNIDYIKNTATFQTGSNFILAHWDLPHSPYLFNRDGSIKSAIDSFKNPKEAYLDQFIYTSVVMLDMAETITIKDPEAMVIILSDHSFRGSDLLDNITTEDQCDIFAAVYWGRKQQPVDIEGLTGINLMRTILNNNFGTNFKMVPAESMVKRG